MQQQQQQRSSSADSTESSVSSYSPFTAIYCEQPTMNVCASPPRSFRPNSFRCSANRSTCQTYGHVFDVGARARCGSNAHAWRFSMNAVVNIEISNLLFIGVYPLVSASPCGAHAQVATAPTRPEVGRRRCGRRTSSPSPWTTS